MDVFDLTDLKFISLDNDELEKCVVRKGDDIVQIERIV